MYVHEENLPIIYSLKISIIDELRKYTLTELVSLAFIELFIALSQINK